MIRRQYGSPSITNYLNILDLHSEYVTFSHTWKPENLPSNKKTINIGIGENEESTFYSAMFIRYLPFVNAKKQETQKKESQTIKKESIKF
jgi:hypothetical protein